MSATAARATVNQNSHVVMVRLILRPTSGVVLRRDFQDEILNFDCAKSVEQFYKTIYFKYNDYSLIATVDKEGKDIIKPTSSDSISFYTKNESELNVYLHSLLKFKPTYYPDILTRILKNEDPVVDRKMNINCNHPSNQKCIHCLDIYAWDEKYLKDDGSHHKYLPFSLHVHKMMYDKKLSIKDLSTFKLPDSPRFCVDTSCRNGHLPWPNGSCGKCLPSTEHLHHQQFRFIDSVVLNSGDIVDRFLGYWRYTGNQQLGFLIGRLEKSKTTPYSVQTRVHGIYRPQLIDSINFIELESSPDDDQELCYLLQKLDMQIVGLIFSDLVQYKNEEGNILFKNFRNHDTYLITAEECLFSAAQQMKYRFKTSLSNSGSFGSYFTTVVVSGDCNGEIELNSYQMSNQCMNLVDSKIVLPTKDAPDYATIRDSESSVDFIPEIKYSMIVNSSPVPHVAKPFPVDYLYVTVPCAFDKEPSESWTDASFNSTILNNLNNPLSIVFNELSKIKSLNMCKDINILHLMTKYDRENSYSNIDKVLNSVKDSTIDTRAIDEFFDSLKVKNGSTTPENINVDANSWSCEYCTFINETSDSSCQMCALPRRL